MTTASTGNGGSSARVRSESVSLTPTNAAKELPNGAALRTAGIDLDLRTARLVLVVVSRHMALTAKGRLRNTLYTNMVYEALRLVMPALCEELEVELSSRTGRLVKKTKRLRLRYVRVPNGVAAQRALGAFDGNDLTRLWATSPQHSDKCLPLSWVLAHLPAPAWRHLAVLIQLGPSEVAQRLEAAIALRRREAGPEKVSCETRYAWALLSQVLHLGQHYGRALHPDLSKWATLPERPSDGVIIASGTAGGKQDVSAPRKSTVQAALALHASEAEWGIYAPSAYPSDLEHRRALRRLLLAMLVPLLGLRRGTLVGLEVADYDPQRPFADGSIGPGLLLRGVIMKNRVAGQDNWWKLPAEIAAVMEAWIACTGRSLRQEGERLLINEERRPYDKVGFTNWFRGHRKNRPVVPLVGLNPKNEGYTPRRCRHFAHQEFRRAWHRWRRISSGHELSDITPEEAAKTALDHDQHDIGYSDFQAVARREEILELALRLSWKGVRPEAFPVPTGVQVDAGVVPVGLAENLEHVEDALLGLTAFPDADLDAHVVEQLARVVALAGPVLGDQGTRRAAA